MLRRPPAGTMRAKEVHVGKPILPVRRVNRVLVRADRLIAWAQVQQYLMSGSARPLRRRIRR
jgi:hypothetical protein